MRIGIRKLNKSALELTIHKIPFPNATFSSPPNTPPPTPLPTPPPIPLASPLFAKLINGAIGMMAKKFRKKRTTSPVRLNAPATIPAGMKRRRMLMGSRRGLEVERPRRDKMRRGILIAEGGEGKEGNTCAWLGEWAV
jgi:hypothetical protein